MLYKRINYFLEVANCLSFTEAAKHKFITQQAMTKHISELEKELGIKLFVRTTRSVNLTPAGKMLRNDFEKIDAQLKTAITKAQKLNKNDSAILTLGFFDGLSSRLFIKPLIAYLRERFPDIQLEVELGDMVSMRNHLMDGELDLCLTTAGDWQLWTGTNITVMRSLPFQFVLSKDHPLAKQGIIGIDSFRDEILYALPPSRLSRTAPAWEAKIPRRMKVIVPTLNNVLINVSMSKGFACLPLMFEGAHSSEYIKVPVSLPGAADDLICGSRNDIDNALITQLVHAIEEFCKAQRDLG